MVDPARALLTDRVAVVTGAAAGIGRAIALAFSRFGAHLALCDRDAEGLDAVAGEARALGVRAETGVLDVRYDEAVGRFLADVAAAYDGKVHVLVNNAGGGFAAPFVDVSAKGQDALIRENFTSAATFVRGVVPLMTAAGGGSVINLTSIEAHRAAPGFAVYSAMKAALANLTKSLALELGDRGIRVNCIAPDVIPTPGIGQIDVWTPLGRVGDADEVAGVAVFLAGDLSSFVTGTTVHVDGGNAAAGGWRQGPDGGFVAS